jgi:hypothetical protein
MAYTPGLKRKELTIVEKTRKLPIQGEILVKKGDQVSYDTQVGRADLPGKVAVINAALALRLETTTTQDSTEQRSLNLNKYMLKKAGDEVDAGEVIAYRKAFLRLLDKECRSPTKCTIEYYSDVTGQIIVREPPVPIFLDAYIPGTVTQVIPKEGVLIRTAAALIQGIFGIGGEAHGELMMLAENPDDILSSDKISAECSGKIIVGGSLVEKEALQKAVETGVKAIIVGGIRDEDLSSFLGYDIGVAITGKEELGLTIILTEGFGRMRMARKTFELLSRLEGRLACVNGATQIRAGVIRPEIIVPYEEELTVGEEETDEEEKGLLEGLKPGLPVRVIGQPYFGALGQVTKLPVELQKIETESYVRVLEVELEDGRKVLVPRANVELIEE